MSDQRSSEEQHNWHWHQSIQDEKYDSGKTQATHSREKHRRSARNRIGNGKQSNGPHYHQNHIVIGIHPSRTIRLRDKPKADIFPHLSPASSEQENGRARQNKHHASCLLSRDETNSPEYNLNEMTGRLNKLRLRNHLNNFVGEGCGLIPRWAARLYGDSDWSSIREALTDWEQSGFLTVLQDPENCEDTAIIVRMYNFIDAQEPLPPRWIDEDKLPPQLR